MEYNSYLHAPFFRITEKDPLQPMEAAIRMSAEEHKQMYKSMRGVGEAVRTNTVARYPEIVRELVAKATSLWF